MGDELREKGGGGGLGGRKWEMSFINKKIGDDFKEKMF